jgi:hypothetical protein
VKAENQTFSVCFQKLCLKKFLIFTVRSLLTAAAMATLIHNATNNWEGTTFTENRQSAPPYNMKTTVDEIGDWTI